MAVSMARQGLGSAASHTVYIHYTEYLHVILDHISVDIH